MIKSRCMFCNSTSYGTGCPYSPHRKHVHTDDPTKCIYCGSYSLGASCPYSPLSRTHVRGAHYNNMIKESMQKSITVSIFLDRLTQPITEMEAFKLGVIDEDGHQIRECTTDAERAALTPIDRQILKIRSLISEDLVDLFKSNTLLEMASKNTDETFDAERYRKQVKLETDTRTVVTNIKELYAEAIENGFSKEYVENLIIESILRQYDSAQDRT